MGFMRALMLLVAGGCLAVVAIVASGCEGLAPKSNPPPAAPAGRASLPVGRAAVPANIPDALSQLDSLPCPKGVSQRTWAELTGALGEALRGKTASELALEPPHGDAAASTLVYSAAGALLNWGYFSPGDYDQNGVVGLSDLVPLAVHFGESTGTGDAFPENSIGAVIDGDGNGELNLADIIAIALNFGVYVEGYRIYAADNTAAYPPSPDSSNGTGAIFIGVASMSLAVEPPTGGRKAFNYQVVPTYAPRYFWVRPTDGETDGAASNYVVVVLPPKQGPIAKLDYPPAAETLAHIVWNASMSFDPDGVISRYEWDFNADGVYEFDSGQAPTADFYYYAPGDYTCTVRVTDNDFYTDTETGHVTVTEKAKWHVTTVEERENAFQNDAPLGGGIELLDVQGQPALLYLRKLAVVEPVTGIDRELAYRRALDANGEQWGDAIQVGRFNLGAGAAFRGTAAFVGGRPALAYKYAANDAGGGTVFDPRYICADDGVGSSWSSWHSLTGAALSLSGLMEYGGKPLLLGLDGSTGFGQASLATDEGGASWSVWRNLGIQLVGLPSVAVIGGRLAFMDAGSDLGYSRALDADFTQWSLPVPVNPLEQAGEGAQLLEVDGLPGVVYYDENDRSLKFRMGRTPDGEFYDPPLILTPWCDSGDKFEALLVDGRPAVFYYDRFDGKLKLVIANTQAADYWTLPSEVSYPTGLQFATDIWGNTALSGVAGSPAFAHLTQVQPGEWLRGGYRLEYGSYW